MGEKSLKTAKNQKSVAKNKPKKISNEKMFLGMKKFFANRNFRYTCAVILMLVISYLVQYFVNKPNLGAFLSSDMDPNGNVYVLGIDNSDDRYRITKILKNGMAAYKINLDKSTDEFDYSYSNLEADSKGNFYFVKQKRNLKAVVADKSVYPILSETVLMFDTNGNYVKELATMDFSTYANPPVKSYIKKIQIVDQSINIIGSKDNVFDIVEAYPLIDKAPEKVKTFTVNAPTSTSDQNLEFVSDVSVLSSGRVFYATKNGEIWATDNQGVFTQCSSAISTSQFLMTGMTVDSNDNIYFNDTLSGGFYKLDTKSATTKSVYSIDKVVIDSSNIAIKDLRKIKAISDGDFYAPSKAFDKPYYARFGTVNHLTSDIRGNIFPWGIIIMLVTCSVLVGIFYVIKFLSKFEIKRIPLAIRILAMFLPLYIVAMGILVFVNTSDSVSEYVSILKSEQERGAKTVVDNIDGSAFSSLDHVAGYMTPDYLKVKNSIEKGYNDLLLKIGDRSDYLVTYMEKYNKLYATISTKYNTNSKSYDELKYTNPDMVASQCVLVDSILERDETEALYSVWDKFSNKTNVADSLEAEFRDVYGNMTGSFVAIKDTNGRVVGFVGNFLDSGIHSSSEFRRIFLHSLAIILIITIFVFAYICFVVRLALRPLKKIEDAITVMSKGEWNTRIRVNTKDELADIAQAFNIMSEKIDRYTSNLIRLNKEYVRYVPNEIFKFMGKEKITQVGLYDNTIVNMNAIYITFNLSCKDSYEFKDENEIFEALNKSYKEMFKVVENNNGVVQSFDGLDAVILFPNSAQDAFKTAIQFKEIELNKVVKEHLNITLGAGDVLIGISGSEDRRGAVVVSDEIMQMFNIDTQIGIIGINMVATKTIIDSLDKSEPYNYRFIGRVGNITDEGYTEIFEIIDASNKYRRDLYMSTKEMFEKGVKEYILNNMEMARSIFTDVLRVNENDKVAVYYLMKCEEHLGRLGGASNSKKGFNGYII